MDRAARIAGQSVSWYVWTAKEEGREMGSFVDVQPTQILDPIKGVKKMPLEEFFTSGHRTCQGCESALVMKLMAKAAGARTIVLGSTGCMYVANTTYYSTSWVVPWMHTQLGSSGSAGLGAGGGLTDVVRQGEEKEEAPHDVARRGGVGGADEGPVATFAALERPQHDLFILLYG